MAKYYILLQMQCDGHGHFLEITQVIRRLELTIVKGVMENRSDSTWAHFVIEVQHVSKSESLPYMHSKIVHWHWIIYPVLRLPKVFTEWTYSGPFCIFCSAEEILSQARFDHSHGTIMKSKFNFFYFNSVYLFFFLCKLLIFVSSSS